MNNVIIMNLSKELQHARTTIPINCFTRFSMRLLTVACAVVSACFVFTSQAANVLTDSGFESIAQGILFPGLTGGWNVYGQAWGNSYIIGTAHSGTNSYKVFQGFTGSVNYNGAYQDNVSGPGDTYLADGWAFTLGSDVMAGGNVIWIEVTFRDAGANILALYRSAVIGTNAISNGIFPTDTWIDLAVTNQYDINNFTITNTVTTLVAPPGTAHVRYQILFQGDAVYSGGSVYFDDCTLNQTGGPVPPVISNISLDDTVALFNYTNTLMFAASSSDVSINGSGIHLTLNGVDVSSKLVITGGGTRNVSVSYTNLVLDRNYTGQISVTDGNNLTATAPVRFDTFNPANFSWEAEDFDFSAGMFIDNPVISTNDPNSYYNQLGTSGIDEYVGNYSAAQPHGWRTNDQVATDFSGDTSREQFTSVGIGDYSIGYFGPTNWVNYTKTYPAGTYNVYARIANGNGGTANSYLDQVTSGAGTANQTTLRLGAFAFPGRGWTAYDFVPLTDPWGNVLSVTLTGKSTLRVTAGPLGGGVNLNFLMLAPARTDLPPAIANVYPDGSQPFQNTNKLTFTVSSANSTVSSGAIHVTLNGTNVSSQLAISGSPTSWNVNLPLSQQGMYTATITATDANGRVSSYTTSFDTFSQSNLMIEAEDFDFNGGLFITNPVPAGNISTGPNSYYLYPAGNPINFAVVGVDLTTPNNDGGEAFAYRPYESCGTEVTSDFLRQKFITAQMTDSSVADYDVGWWNGGTWLNYTRVFTANTYNIYGRLAGGSAFSGTTLNLVTSGAGTSTQVTQLVGSFANPNANGWQSWHWVPLMNTNSMLATVHLTGTSTIKVISGAGLNANFYMLVPASATSVLITPSVSGPNIQLSFPTQSGFNYTVQFKTNLTDSGWQTLTTLPGDGSVQAATDALSRSHRFYQLSIAP